MEVNGNTHGRAWTYMAVHDLTDSDMIPHFLLRTDSILVRTATSEYQIDGWPAEFRA
jgi:hypothetical protein